MYSITQILHPRKDSQGRQKIQIRIIYKRAKVYLPTNFKIDPAKENIKINAIVKKQMSDAEERLLDAIREGLSVQDFRVMFKKERVKNVLLSDYIVTLAERFKGKYSPGTIKHYRSIANKLGAVTFSDISVRWLEDFERGLKLDPNTINANMKRLKSILYKASKDRLISEDQFKDYKVPPYRQKLVEYLTEKEIAAFTKVVKATAVHSKKVAGWYFLLSCYTGWRISDVKRFDKSMIHGDNLVLRATKNKQIVSMPIIPRLKEVLNFVTKHPFDVSEKTVRDYVKEIASMAGIKKNVIFHLGRHSFGNLLAAKGLNERQIAEKMGDSVLISKVYIRVHNEPLNKLIRKLFK